MKCCFICVGDDTLRNQVLDQAESSEEQCEICMRTSALVDITDAQAQFSVLFGAYEENSDGMPFLECIKRDFKLFEGPEVDDSKACEALFQMLGCSSDKKYSGIDVPSTIKAESWQILKDELKHENRFFPINSFEPDVFSDLVASLVVEGSKLQPTFFRSRIQEGVTAFAPSKMGAPPKEVAVGGRANPAGIPYLYLASDAETSIAEVRPQPSMKISVGKFELDPAGLVFIDLRNPRKTTSPFTWQDETKISRLIQDLYLLESLGEELTKPVLPNKANYEYSPSQYLCELIKHSGNYSGVIYNSSVGAGYSLALFHPDNYACSSVETYQVNAVSYDTQLNNNPQTPRLTSVGS